VGDTLVLLTLRGDAILGEKVSSLINLHSATFVENASVETLKDGLITLDICIDGGDRLLQDMGGPPTIKVLVNPVAEILDVSCKVRVIETGNYSLEIVDILGISEVVKEWYVAKDDKKEFEFSIPVTMYGNGAYLVILKTPTARYSEKFIIQR